MCVCVCGIANIDIRRPSHLYLSMNAFWLASQSAAGTWTHRPPPGVSWGAARGWMAARDNNRFEDSQVVEWLMVVGFKSRRVDSWNVLMIWFMCFVYPICLYWKHLPPFSQYQLSHLWVNIIRYSMVPIGEFNWNLTILSSCEVALTVCRVLIV